MRPFSPPAFHATMKSVPPASGTALGRRAIGVEGFFDRARLDHAHARRIAPHFFFVLVRALSAARTVATTELTMC